MDGNIAEAEECARVPAARTVVCAEVRTASRLREPFTDRNGNTMAFDPDLVYGSIDRTSQDANGFGGSLQAVEKTPAVRSAATSS